MEKKYIYLFIIVFSQLFFSISCSNNKIGETEESNNTGITIREVGELAAINSKAFILPRYNYFYEMRIIGILDHGEIVRPGDSIIQLDPTEIKKFILNSETSLETQLAAMEKLLVSQDNQISELESNLKTAKASFELKKNSLEASRFETERIRKIRELQFEQEKISLAREEKKIELNKIVNDNDFKIQEIRINQVLRQIEEVQDIIETLTIRTQYEGIFQIARNSRTGAMIKLGDNIYPGSTLATVPDLKHMKVNTFINENDFLKIYLGQKVHVRLDASPNIIFEGEVSYIGKLCRIKETNSRQKVFDVEVTILKSDERLKPGMTVSCEYLECR